jgi:hypothetical protein
MMAAAVSGRARWSPGNRGSGGTRDVRRVPVWLSTGLSPGLDAKFLGRFSCTICVTVFFFVVSVVQNLVHYVQFHTITYKLYQSNPELTRGIIFFFKKAPTILCITHMTQALPNICGLHLSEEK